jgi:hypothetical protein
LNRSKSVGPHHPYLPSEGGSGAQSRGLEETLITMGFVLIGLTIIVAAILLMWGSRSAAKPEWDFDRAQFLFGSANAIISVFWAMAT